jgi:hypothetical protein
LIHAGQAGPTAQAAASALLDRLILDRRGRPAGELSAIIPVEDWEPIVKSRQGLGVQTFLHRPEEVLEEVERANKAATLFDADAYNRMPLRLDLAKAFHLAGREADGLRVSNEVRRDFADLLRTDGLWGSWFLDQHCWLLRRQGNGTQGARQARADLDAWLLDTQGNVRSDANGPVYFPLVERARIHAALKMWDEAQRDLDRFFKMQAAEPRRLYGFHAGACLLQGFLRERTGDKEGARAAWRRGMVDSWGKEFGQGGQTLALPLNIDLVYHLMLGSLSGALTDQDVVDALTRLADLAGATSAAGNLMSKVKVPPATFREMWTTTRGKEWARRFAYRDLSYRDYTNVPVQLAASEFLHQSLMPGPLAQEHDELFWKLAGDLHDAYLSHIVTEVHAISLGIAWKGNDRFGLGWKVVDNAVLKKQPHLRGPLAYVLGHRSLRQNLPSEAVTYFTIARDTLPANSPGHRLAKAELDRLQPK